MPSDLATSGVYAHPLAYVRAVRGWSASDCLREINAAAKEHLGVQVGYRDRNKVYRWEQRGVIPDRIVQRALAYRLRVPQERLLATPWPTWLPAFDGVRTDYGWTADASLEATEDVLRSDLMDRRGFLALTGGALVGLADEWLRLEPGRVAAVMGGSLRVDDEIVAAVEAQTSLLRRMDDKIGGDTLGAAAHAQLRLAVDLLRAGSYSEHVGLRLRRSAAHLAQFGGWVAFDAGRQTLAQGYYQAALRSAHPAGDRALGGLILACMSYQAATTGNAADAVPLAQAGVQGARQAAAGGRTIALLSSRLAYAHAANGDAAGSARALGEAERALEQQGGGPDPSWAYWFDHTSLVGFEGRCYLLLGRGDLAEPLLAGSESGTGTSYVRDRALRLTRLADARFLAGDVERSCHTAARAIDVAHRSASRRTRTALHVLHSRLAAAADTPAVSDLGNKLADLLPEAG